MSKSAYSFPILKAREILFCFKELSIDFSLEQLREPTADLVRPVYEQFADILMGISREELRQPEFKALDNFEYPELHDDSVVNMTMIKNLLKLFAAVGVSDCSMRDLLMPDPIRTKRIFSGLINFAKFREERLATYQDFTTQTDKLLELKAKLEEDTATRHADAAELRAHRAQREPDIAALEEAAKALQADINEKKTRLEALARDAEANEQRIHEHDGRLAKDGAALDATLAVVEKLSMQVIDSPRRAKKELDAMEASISTRQEEVETARKKLRALQSKKQALEKVDNKIIKRTNAMNEARTLLKQKKEVFTKIKDENNQVLANQNTMRQLVNHDADLKKRITQGQEKLVRLQRQFATKRTAAQTALQQVGREKQQLMQTLESERQQIEQNDAIAVRKRAEIAALEPKYEAELKELREKYAQFQQSIADYHERMRIAMREASQKTQPVAVGT